MLVKVLASGYGRDSLNFFKALKGREVGALRSCGAARFGFFDGLIVHAEGEEQRRLIWIGFGDLAIDLGIGRQRDRLAVLGDGDAVVDGLLDLGSAGALLGLLYSRLHLVDGGARRQGGPPQSLIVGAGDGFLGPLPVAVDQAGGFKGLGPRKFVGAGECVLDDPGVGGGGGGIVLSGAGGFAAAEGDRH